MKLEIKIYRFSGPSYTINACENEITVVSADDERPQTPHEEKIRPEPEKWDMFWDFMNSCGDWKQTYVKADVMDGAQWSVVAEKGDLNIVSSGDNDFPPNWDQFLSQVEKLLGISNFG